MTWAIGVALLLVCMALVLARAFIDRNNGGRS